MKLNVAHALDPAEAVSSEETSALELLEEAESQQEATEGSPDESAVLVTDDAAVPKAQAALALAKYSAAKLHLVPMPKDNETVLQYLPLVRKIAARIARRVPPHVCLDDLVSAGVVGVLEALDRFDASRGQRFESFAEFRIKGAILDELRRADPMARDARIASKKLEKSISDLAQNLGHAPEEEELAKHLACTVEELRDKFQQLGQIHVFNLDDLTSNELNEYEANADWESPFRQVAMRELKQKLVETIDRLTPRLRTVISLYYYEGLQLKEIGQLLGVTTARVSQMLSEATLHLRALLGTADSDEVATKTKAKKVA